MAAYRSISVAKIQPNIGAEISGVDLTQPIAPNVADELRQALLDFQVIVLRDQKITREQHRAFTAVFTRNKENPFFVNETQAKPIEGYPEILNVFGDGITNTAADVWHTDGSWCVSPPEVSVLRSTDIMPSCGGDTCFASAGDAYDGLPDDVKARIRYLKALHWKGYTKKTGKSAYGGMADDAKMDEAKIKFPPVAHPVVRLHPETRRPTLFVNYSYVGKIVGMEEKESEELLAYLYNELLKPDYQMRLRWTKHALAVWDNRAVQHCATANYTEPRMLERMTVCGVDEPLLGFADIEAETHAAPARV